MEETCDDDVANDECEERRGGWLGGGEGDSEDEEDGPSTCGIRNSCDFGLDFGATVDPTLVYGRVVAVAGDLPLTDDPPLENEWTDDCPKV